MSEPTDTQNQSRAPEFHALLEQAEALVTDLRNAANGYGIGNLHTKANLAQDILAGIQSLGRYDNATPASDYGEPWELVSQQGFRKSLVDRRGLPVRSVALHLRAAQCVNACAGVSDPEGAFADLRRKRDKARAALIQAVGNLAGECPACTEAGFCGSYSSAVEHKGCMVAENNELRAVIVEAHDALSSAKNHCYSDGTVHHQRFDSEKVTAVLDKLKPFLPAHENV